MGKKAIIGIQIGIVVFTLLVWEVLANNIDSFKFLLGSPSLIINEFIILWKQERYWYHFYITAAEALVGFLIGTSLGTCAGLGMWYSASLAKITKPFILAFGTIPVFAFAPLLVMWFGVGFLMKVILVIMSTFFIAFTQAFRGATSVSKSYLQLLEIYEATNHAKFFKVILPGSIDWVLSSLRLNVGFALLGAFIGEFISSESGLGRLILRATGLYNVPRALAAAFGMVVIALLFDAAATYIESRRHSLIQLISVPRSIKSHNKKLKTRKVNK